MSGTPTVDGAQHMAEEQTEHEFMRHVIAYAKARDWLVYHTHIAKRSAEGFPDLTMVREGRLVFAELKREKGGRVSLAQDTWLRELGRVEHESAVWAGAEVIARPVRVYLWRPSDWPEIERVLA